jgi:hypothetical protein
MALHQTLVTPTIAAAPARLHSSALSEVYDTPTHISGMLSSLLTLKSGKTADTRHDVIHAAVSARFFDIIPAGHAVTGHTSPISTNAADQTERCIYPTYISDQRGIHGVIMWRRTNHHAQQRGDHHSELYCPHKNCSR